MNNFASAAAIAIAIAALLIVEVVFGLRSSCDEWLQDGVSVSDEQTLNSERYLSKFKIKF